MKKHIEPLHAGMTYHVYNRGINKETIFRNDNNYRYFLKKYFHYLNTIADTYCFCLLENHFHFLLKIKTEEAIRQQLNSIKHKTKTVEQIISQQFSNLFNGYAQAYNKMYNRTGGLFEEPFRRKLIDSDDYFSKVIAYIHLNPVKHQLTNKFEDYLYSSYRLVVNTANSSDLQTISGVNHQIEYNPYNVIKWFGLVDEFINFHKNQKANYTDNIKKT